MTKKVKKIYFTDDFSAENVEKLQGEGWILRDRRAVTIGDFIEEADEYGGDVPEWYTVKGETITVTLTTETSPELQKAIDEAKAECEKVVTENTELKEQLDKEREAVQKLTAEVQGIATERDALSNRVKELDLENVELKEALTKDTAKTTKAAKSEQPKE